MILYCKKPNTSRETALLMDLKRTKVLTPQAKVLVLLRAKLPPLKISIFRQKHLNLLIGFCCAVPQQGGVRVPGVCEGGGVDEGGERAPPPRGRLHPRQARQACRHAPHLLRQAGRDSSALTYILFF
jgi:hypothetical protein